jgi:hypothetical protein
MCCNKLCCLYVHICIVCSALYIRLPTCTCILCTSFQHSYVKPLSDKNVISLYNKLNLQPSFHYSMLPSQKAYGWDSVKLFLKKVGLPVQEGKFLGFLFSKPRHQCHPKLCFLSPFCICGYCFCSTQLQTASNTTNTSVSVSQLPLIQSYYPQSCHLNHFVMLTLDPSRL